jgi:predicted permease
MRFALRQLLKNPGFTTVAVLTLALGIGACTAMFGVVHAVLLRPLPFQNSERLVWIENVGTGGLSARTSRADNFLDWRERNQSFEKLGAYFAFFDYVRFTLIDHGEPQRLRGVGISQNLLDVLGVPPLLGRPFNEEECVWNGRKAVILSHAFWQQHYKGDRGVVGRTITLNNDPTEIVGVLPPSFDFDSVFAPGTEIEMLVPFPLAPETARWGNTIFSIGRLKPGVTRQQAQAEFDILSRQIGSEHSERGTFGARMSSLEDSVRGAFRTPMIILSVAVFCVLLIACVNLSNLLLARANGRAKEFAIRAALGAGRWRLVRQVLLESMVLAVAGCLAGLPLAFGLTGLLARLDTFSIPLLQTTTVDPTVLFFTAGVACLAGLLCGMLPAWRLWHDESREALSDAGERGSGGRSAATLRRGLVVAEVALACVLLVSAGLLIRSFAEVLKVDLGFQSNSAATWRVDPVREFPSLAEGNRYYDRLVEKLESIPGVQMVGLTDTLPLGRNRTWMAGAKGVSYERGNFPIAFPRMVDHRYLQAMRIPLRSGRYFDARDTAETENVIIINETMARGLWPGEDAVGHVVSLGQSEWRVVGVVSDVRHATLEERSSPEMYLNFRQMSDWFAIDVVVRSTRPLPALVGDVRTALKQYDPMLPNAEFTTLDQIVDHAVAPRRLITQLLGGFSSLALLLAALGLYGVIAYSVTQRTRELGIRMAIGAQRSDILRLILRDGMVTAGLGVLIGLAGAFFATRLLQGMLFGISAFNPTIFALNAVFLLGVALAASFIPARRAARLDPNQALHHE